MRDQKSWIVFLPNQTREWNHYNRIPGNDDVLYFYDDRTRSITSVIVIHSDIERMYVKGMGEIPNPMLYDEICREAAERAESLEAPIPIDQVLSDVTAEARGNYYELAAPELSRLFEAAKQQERSGIVTLQFIDPEVLEALRTTPELLHALSGRTFERVLAELLSQLGYEIELQRGTKDGGVDIFAIRRVDPLGPHRYLLQAKRWKHAVGVEPVRHLLFLQQHHRATKSCLVTTSRFTSGAWQLANQYAWQLELKDYQGLKEWIARAK
jgi:HJR/Mrr/RecB family endonuclease